MQDDAVAIEASVPKAEAVGVPRRIVQTAHNRRDKIAVVTAAARALEAALTRDGISGQQRVQNIGAAIAEAQQAGIANEAGASDFSRDARTILKQAQDAERVLTRTLEDLPACMKGLCIA